MCFCVIYMYPCSKILCSNQQGYSEITSSASSNSKICCIRCARLAGSGVLVVPAELPCLLRLPELFTFSSCLSSLAGIFNFVFDRRSLDVTGADSSGGGRGGRSWEEDIWSIDWPSVLASVLLLSLGKERNSLFSDKTLRCCLPCRCLLSCDSSDAR